MLTSAIILSITMVIECILFMEYKRKYARQTASSRNGRNGRNGRNRYNLAR